MSRIDLIKPRIDLLCLARDLIKSRIDFNLESVRLSAGVCELCRQMLRKAGIED